MLQVTFSNTTINPQRPEAPTKTFGSEDVPHGTDSVICKACKIANFNGYNFPVPPPLSEEELAAHKADFKATLEVLPLFDEDGNPITYLSPQPNQILEISEEEVKKGFYSNYPLPENSEEELQPRMIQDPMFDHHGSQQMYADLAACKVALTDAAKDLRAQLLLDKAVEDCLLVPVLSEDFKAQFTLTEIE